MYTMINTIGTIYNARMIGQIESFVVNAKTLSIMRCQDDNVKVTTLSGAQHEVNMPRSSGSVFMSS